MWKDILKQKSWMKPKKSLGERFKEHQHNFRQRYKKHLEWVMDSPMTNSKHKALGAFYYQLITNHEKKMAEKLRQKIMNLSNVDISQDVKG